MLNFFLLLFLNCITMYDRRNGRAMLYELIKSIESNALVNFKRNAVLIKSDRYVADDQ